MIPDLEEFIKEHCNNCKNKDTDLCEVRRTVAGNLRCVYEEKEKARW